MIIPVYHKEKEDTHTMYFYLIIHGRESKYPVVKIQGDSDQVIREIKYMMLTDIVGNLSTFVCQVYKDVDTVQLLSDKEVINNLYTVLEKIVKAKEIVDDTMIQEREYIKIAKGILKYRKELFSTVHVLGKDEGRFAQYVSLVNSCRDIVDNDISTFFKQ